jgi:Protein of unknown function (DUF3102)
VLRAVHLKRKIRKIRYGEYNLKPLNPDPPAIVREADSLAQLASEINALHAAGEETSRKGLAHFRDAGKKLLAAKEKCGHGNWLAWLKTNVKVSERHAQNYMRLAKSAVTADLDEQWKIIQGNVPDEDEEPQEESAEEVEDEDEAEDSDEDKEEEEPEAAPDPAAEFVGRIDKLCHALDAAKKEASQLVAVPILGLHLHGDSVTHAIQAARQALWQSRPTEPCNCVSTDNPAKTECRLCYGSGFVSAGRAARVKK